MIVWAVSSGCIYEGGGLDGIFSTLKKARAFALKKVKEENDQKRIWNTDPEFKGKFFYRHKFFTKIPGMNKWQDRSNYISISSWELDNENQG